MKRGLQGRSNIFFGNTKLKLNWKVFYYCACIATVLWKHRMKMREQANTTLVDKVTVGDIMINWKVMHSKWWRVQNISIMLFGKGTSWAIFVSVKVQFLLCGWGFVVFFLHPANHMPCAMSVLVCFNITAWISCCNWNGY